MVSFYASIYRNLAVDGGVILSKYNIGTIFVENIESFCYNLDNVLEGGDIH